MVAETEPVLRIDRLSKQFGGLAAVSGVSLELRSGELHALIGPNGAGKTTLLNLLSGDLSPSGGSVRYRGREIAGLAADRIARLGIGRSYQKTNIFAEFSVFENCRLAAQARHLGAMRFVRAAFRYGAVNDAARRALALAGLEERESIIAASLSHGEQRQLEIAMTLATSPDVLLLDEPLAGMGAEEAQRMVALIDRLAADHAIILVEHDMDAVFSVARVLTVMVNGRVLESGAPDAVRRSRAVQEAYLGEAPA
jgi:branched-chain amino acid transport system ATP-binding protein